MKINKIKLICEACWLTQREFAEFTGIKFQRIRDMSTARVDGFKPDELKVLVDKLHINPEWLTAASGEIFKAGYERSYPSKKVFVAEVLKRITEYKVKFFNESYNEILELPPGTIEDWIEKAYIPYWFLKREAEEHNVSIEVLIYGIVDNSKDYIFRPPNKLVAQQELAVYGSLSIREKNLIDDFRELSDREKDALETMLHAAVKPKKRRDIVP